LAILGDIGGSCDRCEGSLEGPIPVYYLLLSTFLSTIFPA